MSNHSDEVRDVAFEALWTATDYDEKAAPVQTEGEVYRLCLVELDDSYSDQCRWCLEGLLVERVTEHYWQHQHEPGMSRCHAYAAHERRYQRLTAGKE